MFGWFKKKEPLPEPKPCPVCGAIGYYQDFISFDNGHGLGSVCGECRYAFYWGIRMAERQKRLAFVNKHIEALKEPKNYYDITPEQYAMEREFHNKVFSGEIKAQLLKA